MSRPDVMSESVERDSVFVDTNVFLRFLTNDVPEQAAAVEALFQRAAAGEVRLTTNAMVLTELVWVLESYYHLGRPQVQERAMAVACMDGLLIPEVDVVIDALLAYGEASRLLKNDAAPSGHDRRAREKDAGSANSGAIGATEDVLSRWPACLDGRGFVLQQPPRVDFIDAYNACWMRGRGLSRVATFDKQHYSRLEGMVIYPL